MYLVFCHFILFIHIMILISFANLYVCFLYLIHVLKLTLSLSVSPFSSVSIISSSRDRMLYPVQFRRSNHFSNHFYKTAHCTRWRCYQKKDINEWMKAFIFAAPFCELVWILFPLSLIHYYYYWIITMSICSVLFLYRCCRWCWC